MERSIKIAQSHKHKENIYVLIINEIFKEIKYQYELDKFSRYNSKYLKMLLDDIVNIKNHLINGFLDKYHLSKLNDIFYNFFIGSFYELKSVKEDLHLELSNNLYDNNINEIYKDIIRVEGNISYRRLTVDDILTLKECYYAWILDEDEVNEKDDITYQSIILYLRNI